MRRFLILPILALLLSGCSESATRESLESTEPAAEPVPKAPAVASLQAIVVPTESGTLKLANDSQERWRNCDVQLNSGAISSGFSLTVEVFEPQQIYEVGLAQFVDGDGLRFDPSSRKLQKVSILCQDVAGTFGSAHTRFR